MVSVVDRNRDIVNGDGLLSEGFVVEEVIKVTVEHNRVLDVVSKAFPYKRLYVVATYNPDCFASGVCTLHHGAFYGYIVRRYGHHNIRPRHLKPKGRVRSRNDA